MGIGDTDGLPSAIPMNSASSGTVPGSAPPARRSVDLSVLTRAESDVVALALDGLSVREISERLVVSESTVHTHLTHVYQKLGVKGRLDLLALSRSPQAAPQPLEVASPRASSARGFEAGIAIAIIGILVALVLPIAAVGIAPALLAAGVVTARKRSLDLGGARLPLLVGALVCLLLALMGFLFARVAA